MYYLCCFRRPLCHLSRAKDGAGSAPGSSPCRVIVCDSRITDGDIHLCSPYCLSQIKWVWMWRSGATQLVICAEGWLMTGASEEVVRFEWRRMRAEMPRFPTEGERRDRLSSWAQTRGWMNHACPKVWICARSRGDFTIMGKREEEKKEIVCPPSWFIRQTSSRKSFTAKQQLQHFMYIQKFCSHFFCCCCCACELILKWVLLELFYEVTTAA